MASARTSAVLGRNVEGARIAHVHQEKQTMTTRRKGKKLRVLGGIVLLLLIHGEQAYALADPDCNGNNINDPCDLDCESLACDPNPFPGCGMSQDCGGRKGVRGRRGVRLTSERGEPAAPFARLCCQCLPAVRRNWCAGYLLHAP